jgi:hypothetical protein
MATAPPFLVPSPEEFKAKEELRGGIAAERERAFKWLKKNGETQGNVATKFAAQPAATRILTWSSVPKGRYESRFFILRKSSCTEDLAITRSNCAR